MRTSDTKNSGNPLDRAPVCGTLLVTALLLGCGAEQASMESSLNQNSAVEVRHGVQEATYRSRLSKYPPRLSDYGLLRQPLCELQPAEGVMEYELNTPLFTDYAQKQRLIKLPAATPAEYTPSGPLDFPVGTIIAKTFYYAADLNDPASRRHIVETRILEHRESGWIGIPYVWNEEQTDADLAIAGGRVEVAWQHTDGQRRTNTHAVPNLNDCKRCHASPEMMPIGPKANNLNREFAYQSGHQNQLAHWSANGLLTGLPELSDVPRLAVWNDSSLDTNDRARAYLEVNCAHCHNPVGPARNSGLHLNIEETNPYHLGTFKSPVAAGKGTGGRLYGIVPGKPDESIVAYRMRTTEAGEIMPEFGKTLVHDEGLALIRQWITEMH
jgi:uncharacterized repeat protein (TIGR03806 family)